MKFFQSFFAYNGNLRPQVLMFIAIIAFSLISCASVTEKAKEILDEAKKESEKKQEKEPAPQEDENNGTKTEKKRKTAN
jgi:hypothetical protein